MKHQIVRLNLKPGSEKEDLPRLQLGEPFASLLKAVREKQRRIITNKTAIQRLEAKNEQFWAQAIRAKTEYEKKRKELVRKRITEEKLSRCFYCRRLFSNTYLVLHCMVTEDRDSGWTRTSEQIERRCYRCAKGLPKVRRANNCYKVRRGSKWEMINDKKPFEPEQPGDDLVDCERFPDLPPKLVFDNR